MEIVIDYDRACQLSQASVAAIKRLQAQCANEAVRTQRLTWVLSWCSQGGAGPGKNTSLQENLENIFPRLRICMKANAKYYSFYGPVLEKVPIEIVRYYTTMYKNKVLANNDNK